MPNPSFLSKTPGKKCVNLGRNSPQQVDYRYGLSNMFLGVRANANMLVIWNELKYLLEWNASFLVIYGRIL